MDAPSAQSAYAAITVSFFAAIVWTALLVRVLQRAYGGWGFVQPLTFLIVSIGTLASAVGFAEGIGAVDLSISASTMTLIASMGRGALLMGGVLGWWAYLPADHDAQHAGRKRRKNSKRVAEQVDHPTARTGAPVHKDHLDDAPRP